MRPIVFSIALLAAYALPWIVNPGAGLTFGAYDLAEWATLHPDVRTNNLIASLMLRVPLICIALMLAFSPSQKGNSNISHIYSLIKTLIVFGILLFAMPPVEFFLGDFNDVNYRQQFGLGFVGLLFAGVGLAGITPAIMKSYLLIGFAIVGLVSGLIGLEITNQLMLDFILPTQRGLGVILMSLLLLMASMMEIIKLRTTQGKLNSPVS